MKKQEWNTNIAVSEDEFLKVLDEMEAAELEELEKIAAEAEKKPHIFSKEFEEWKEQIIQEREKESFIYRVLNTPFKKAAVVVILAGAIALGTGGQSEAGKFPVVKFFQELYGDHIEIEPHEDLWSNEEKPQTIETVYELGWVPEGYEKEREEITEYIAMQVYSNGKEKINLKQYCVYVYYSINEDKNDYKEMKKNGVKYYYLEKDGEITVVWYRAGYQFSICASNELNEMLKMADMLQKEN